MDICKRLNAAKDDEANGILEYAKLKTMLTSEEHIDTIENIIFDEYDHLMEILAIIEDLKCGELPNEETELKMKQIRAVYDSTVKK